MADRYATSVMRAGPMATQEAARILATGGLVAFPTETVYGLGADVTNGEAVARLYAAKSRPAFNPLIAHVCDAAGARDVGDMNDDAKRLGAAFWPGPLTLVLPMKPGCAVSSLARAGLETVAVRVPDHAVAQSLLAAFGKPVVAPSANRSGHVSATNAAHVLADLDGRIDLIIDGGPSRAGLESTIVACLDGDPALLRAGALARHLIEQALGKPLRTDDGGGPHVPLSPGQLASHYAPKAPLRLGATTVTPGEALLAFGDCLPVGSTQARTILNLSEKADLAEAAANLFSHLRQLDAADADAIAVMPIPTHGLGEAINDRLRRAAAPRS